MEIHPLAELIPSMRDEEYRALREDIAEHGLHDPITLYEGKVLDGRHRMRACDELGIDPATREYDGLEPAAYVLSANVHRRHLSKIKMAEICRIFIPHLKDEARQRQKEAGKRRGRGIAPVAYHQSYPKSGGRVRDQITNLTGGAVEGGTVELLDRVARDAPDLHEKVLKQEMGIRPAYDELRSREKNGEKAYEPNTERKKAVAKRNYERLGILLGQVQAIADGVEAINLDAAMSLLRLGDANEWIGDIRRTRSALLSLSNLLRKESEHGHDEEVA